MSNPGGKRGRSSRGTSGGPTPAKPAPRGMAAARGERLGALICVPRGSKREGEEREGEGGRGETMGRGRQWVGRGSHPAEQGVVQALEESGGVAGRLASQALDLADVDGRLGVDAGVGVGDGAVD